MTPIDHAKAKAFAETTLQFYDDPEDEPGNLAKAYLALATERPLLLAVLEDVDALIRREFKGDGEEVLEMIHKAALPLAAKIAAYRAARGRG